MVVAMNYMGELGEKYIQAYVMNIRNQNVLHLLLYKDITDPTQIKQDLDVKNIE